MNCFSCCTLLKNIITSVLWMKNLQPRVPWLVQGGSEIQNHASVSDTRLFWLCSRKILFNSISYLCLLAPLPSIFF